MEKIKELITTKSIGGKFFFTVKDIDSLKKAFRVLTKIGFKWSSDFYLSNLNLFDKVSHTKCFSIREDGVCFSSRESYVLNKYIEKDIFDFFEELGIKIESKCNPFFIDWIDCLSSIKTKNGFNVRILCSDLKDEKQLVFAYSPYDNTEMVSFADNDGKTLIDSFDLVLESETVELKVTEMTIPEIEKALGVYNLKIVK